MGERPLQQTREQERAASAWQAIGQLSDDVGEKYGSQARRLPTLIQFNGLGQTMAFLKSKSDKRYMQLLYQHVSDWVVPRIGSQQDLMEAITHWDSDTYRRATTEALAYALWLRRFVEAKGWGQAEDED